MQNVKILVVEDEDDAANVLKSFLGRRGYAVTAASEGARALEMIKAEAPDLVLLDINLAGMSGLDVLRRLRAEGFTLPVIMMTGQFLVAGDEAEVLSLGVSEYLQKPVLLTSLDAAVTRALAGAPPVSVFLNKVTETADDPAECHFHKIANILSVIRIQCGNYILDVEDGVDRKKTVQDQQALVLRVMKDIAARVDQVVTEIECIRRRKVQ
ncbi:MAG: response regulator [Candidatus Omnitrophota bacterium]